MPLVLTAGAIACRCGLSLDEVSELEFLWLYGTTKVLDENLAPIADLPRLREVRMKSRANYRPRLEDIQTRLAQRRS